MIWSLRKLISGEKMTSREETHKRINGEKPEYEAECFAEAASFRRGWSIADNCLQGLSLVVIRHCKEMMLIRKDL